MRKPPPRQVFPPPADRLWAKVDKSGDCWVWMGYRTPFGHGQIIVDGQKVWTHRLSWELVHGPIPAGMYICHRCDNPPCVRPDHLFLGTPKDNVRDCIAKGRLRPPVRVAVDVIRAIRARRAQGASYPQLRQEFGFGYGTLHRYVTGIGRPDAGEWRALHGPTGVLPADPLSVEDVA